MILVNYKVGVTRFSDGWNVVVKVGDNVSVYDPTYETEEEAVAKAEEVSALLRRHHE